MATPKKRPTATGRTPKCGEGGATGTPAKSVKLNPNRAWMGGEGTITHQMLEIPIDFKKLP